MASFIGDRKVMKGWFKTVKTKSQPVETQLDRIESKLDSILRWMEWNRS